MPGPGLEICGRAAGNAMLRRPVIPVFHSHESAGNETAFESCECWSMPGCAAARAILVLVCLGAEAATGAGYRRFEVVKQWRFPVVARQVAGSGGPLRRCQDSFADAGGGAVGARIRFAINSMRSHQETRPSTIRWISVARDRLIPRGYRQNASVASRRAES